MQRNHLKKVISELKAYRRNLPFGIDVTLEDGAVLLFSEEWKLGFAITEGSIEDYHDAFENCLPHLIQQIQHKASLQ